MRILSICYGCVALTSRSAVRIEWCQARARAHRWSEECKLLEEEMRRVIDFFGWQASWWLGKADDSNWDHTAPMQACSPQHIEGRQAYARRQAASRFSMIKLCAKTWQCVPEYLGYGAQLDK